MHLVDSTTSGFLADEVQEVERNFSQRAGEMRWNESGMMRQ